VPNKRGEDDIIGEQRSSIGDNNGMNKYPVFSNDRVRCLSEDHPFAVLNTYHELTKPIPQLGEVRFIPAMALIEHRIRSPITTAAAIATRRVRPECDRAAREWRLEFSFARCLCAPG
jgi:hypothetical protein